MTSLSKQIEKTFFDDYSKIRELLVKSIKDNIQLYEKFSLVLQFIYCIFFIGILVDKKIIQAKNQKRFSHKKLFSIIMKNEKPHQLINDIINGCNSKQVFQLQKIDTLVLNIPFLNLDFFKDYTIEKFELFNLYKKNWMKIFNFASKYLTKIDFLESDFFGTILERDLTMVNTILLEDISEVNLSKINKKMNDRKKLGVYFTPKEVTKHIVNQSIFDQLEYKTKLSFKNKKTFIDKLTPEELIKLNSVLSKISILDPACGSGEFLLEAANELLELRIKIAENLGLVYNIRKFKFDILENNLFGVDIQEISIKITKLKLWFWYIQDLSYKDVVLSTQRFLPNLFQNFHVGNSLIGYSFEEIPEVRYDYYIQPEIYILINSHLLKLQRSLANYSDVMILNNIIRIYTILKSIDFEQTIFTNQDILIRFYVSIERALIELPLSKVFSRELYSFYFEISYLLNLIVKGKYRKQLQEKNSLEISRDELRNRIPLNWNIAFRKIQNRGGFNIIIGNPPYIENKKIRNKVLKEIIKTKFNVAYKLYDMAILFLEQSYRLLKQGGTCSFIITNKFLTTDYGIKIRELLLLQTKLKEIIDVSHIPIFNQTATYPIILTFSKASSTLDQDNLSNVFSIYPKINNLKQLEQLPSKIQMTHRDVFNLPNKIFDLSGNFKIIKKITTNLACKNLSTYGSFKYRIFGFTDWQDYLNYLVKQNITNKDLRFIGTANVNKYQISFKKPLKLSGKEIIKSYISYSNHFEEKWKIFRKPKLVIREIAQQLSVAYDPGFYANLTGLYMFLPNEISIMKPLIVILNSNVLDFYYTSLFGSTHLAGNYLRYNGSYLKELPIIIPDEIDKQKCLSNLMDYQTFLLHSNELDDKQDIESINKVTKYLQFFNTIANCLVYELYFSDEINSNLFTIVGELIIDIPFDEWFIKTHNIEIKPTENEEIIKLQKMIWLKIQGAYSNLQINEIKKEIKCISSHENFDLINKKYLLNIHSFL